MASFGIRYAARFSLVLILFSLLPALSQAEPPEVSLQALASDGVLPMSGTMELLTTGTDASLADVLAMPDKDWQRTEAQKRNYGQSDFAFWFRLRLTPGSSPLPPSFLRMNYPLLDEFDVYFFSAGEPVAQYAVGDTRHFDARPVDSRVFLFPLAQLSGQPVDVYLRAASKGPIEVPLDIVTAETFYQQDKQDLVWFGAYFGVMIVMFFFNLFVYLLVRDSTYLYYLFYVAATAAIQFAVVGMGFQYIWPNHPQFSNPAVLLLTIVSALAAVMFVRKFVHLDKNGKPLERWVGKALVVIFSSLLLAVFVLPYRPVLNVTHLLSFVAVILGVYVGVAFWLRGVRAARTFAIAWIVYLSSIAFYLADLHNLIDAGFVASRALQVGSAMELVLLSLAFGQRINDEKEMRLRAQSDALDAQTRMNESLDMLVRQRTQELEDANRQLTEASIRDPLTGVFNRRHFDKAFEVEYQRCHRDLNWLSVMMIDVDHFKAVNDKHGHQAGDEILKLVADVLARAAQRPHDVLARFGGEEFVVLMPGAHGDAARQVAEDLCAAMASMPIDYRGQEIPLTISIGLCACIPDSPDGGGEFLRRADENLYHAKRNGRNQVVG